MISIITDRINRYISEASFDENDKRAQEIDRVIGRCEEVSPREWHGSIILRAMATIYQYQMLAYSKDMLRNLAEKEKPFDFPEIEIEAPLETWKERTLEYNEIESFLKEKEVAAFCTQNNELNRPDKALRNGPTEIVKYVFSKDREQNNHLFIKIDKAGRVCISALIAAIISKTYLDIGNEKLLVDIKKQNGWDHEVTFRNALASSNVICRPRLASDLAYRLFVVAFHSDEERPYPALLEAG
ncbi:MAG: hypothetical protein Q4G00_11225 [Clostridia bacterium]|nr:hypothetical protein [Clostridia bacterium]